MDEFPYFGLKIPPSWLSNRVLDVEIIDPLEWVAYEKKKNVFTIAQVGYPILPSDFVSYDNIKDISSLKYVIYLREYDEDGKKVSIRKLSKFKFTIEDTSTEMLASPQMESLKVSAHSDEFYLSSSSQPQHKPTKNTSEGWRWVKQAEVEFGMLEVNNLHAQDDPTLRGFGWCVFFHTKSVREH